MIFTVPAGLALLALAVPVLALHVLRPHREARPVSSTVETKPQVSGQSCGQAPCTTRVKGATASATGFIPPMCHSVCRPAYHRGPPVAEHRREALP